MSIPRRVKGINRGSSGSLLNWVMVVGDTLCFSADDGRSGSDLWALDVSGDLPVITLTASPAIGITENSAKKMIFIFRRTSSLTTALTVNYTVVRDVNSGSGCDGIAAMPAIQSVSFSAGAATVTVDPTVDFTIEADETVSLALAAGSGYAIGTGEVVSGSNTMRSSVEPAGGVGRVITAGAADGTAPQLREGPTTSSSMAIGMNLESVVDWSPAWTFTDVFKASRPWISHTFNTETWVTTWDPAVAPPLNLDANGNVLSLQSWTQNGVIMKQFAGTLMFRDVDYPAGIYLAEWDGIGVVDFGNDAVVISSGRTGTGRNFARLQVTPSGAGIYMRIEQTTVADPVRNFNVWMPSYNGQSFEGQRWQPGASFSPFHPLFKQRLAPFKTLRFMGMQETNTSDITTWSQRRDANHIRQGSGAEGTPSEPIANGISLEYMVQLANDLDADPWFNMPHQADDTFVRNFASYVRQHLEPDRKVYVEWANELWNFGWGFEASQWVAERARSAGLDPDYGQWIITGQEAKRDFDIWSEVFAGQTDHQLVRVAAGWAAVDWVTNEIAENMGGAFDAIAIAPYITPTDEQRASYTATTSVEQVLTDTRTNLATAVQWVSRHNQLADQWSTRLGRPIQLLAYEGGPHLDGRNQPYQGAFYAATNDPRMGDIYRDYLRGLNTAGLDLYMDFQFTGAAGEAPWGDFAKLHRMDQDLNTAYRYNAVVAAANGSLWSPSLSIGAISANKTEGSIGILTPFTFRVSRSGDLSGSISADWNVTGIGSSPANFDDFANGVLPAGTVFLAANESSQTVTIQIRGDGINEADETFQITLFNPTSGATLNTATAIGTITNDDPGVDLTLSPGSVTEDGSSNLIYTFTRTGVLTNSLTVNYSVAGSATLGTDYTGISATGTTKSITFSAGSATATVIVDPTADSSVEADETVVLTLAAGSGYTIGSTAAVVGTISNDDSQIALAVAPASVAEDGSTNLIYTFTRTGFITNSLTVNYSVAGSATLGTDYTGISAMGTTKSVNFAAGSSTAIVIVDPMVDTTVENNETVSLSLVAGMGYTIGTTVAAIGTIMNDDLPAITLSLSAASVVEDGSSNLIFTFTRTGPVTTALTVNYTVGGSATLGTDYTGVSATGTTKSITFAAGSPTATVIVNPTADNSVEADETVALSLVAGTVYTAGTTEAVTGTITNDDTQVTLAVAPASSTEDSSTNLIYTFSRAGALANALTVHYTVSGSASLGIDYTGISTTGTTKSVNFAAGSAIATVIVDPTADAIIEADESIALTLALGKGYTIGTTGAVISTIRNDDFPIISLTVSPAIGVAEDGSSNLIFTFARTGPVTTALTVNYSVGGSATLGSDCTGIAATPAIRSIDFPAGAATVILIIDPSADATAEDNEIVALTLAAGSGYTIGTTTAIEGTILNDDSIGTDASDILVGTSLDEYIFGAAGNDTLQGNAGRDRLDGGFGADVLTGGSGKDTFFFGFSQSPLATPDHLTDFTIGSDKIDLLTATGVALPAPSAFSRAGNSGATSLATVVSAVFTDANGAIAGNQSLVSSGAALVVATHTAIAGTYLVINDNVAGFQTSEDLVINLTGRRGILPALGAIPVSSWFV